MKMKFVLFFLLFTLLQTAKAEDFITVNIKKDTINLMDFANKNHLFVIVFNGKYSCFECFLNLIKSIENLQKILTIN